MITKAKYDALCSSIEGSRVKATYSEENGTVEITVPAGRELRLGRFRDPDVFDNFLQNPIGQIFCVGPYAAISCYDDGWVESIIEFGIPLVGPAQLWYRTFFGSNVYENKPPIPIELISGNITITIQPASDILRSYLPFFDDIVRPSLGPGARPLASIHIKSEPFKTNEAVADLLVRLANSVFFQIDLLKGMPFALRRIRQRPQYSTGRRSDGKLAEMLEFPKHEYDAEALSYFWAARATRHSPHFQYLAYYQAIEYYFRTFTKRLSAERVRHLLQDPTFRSDRHSDVTKLINACEVGDSLGEREQLKLTLSACVTEEKVREWLDGNDTKREFLTTKKGKAISDLILPLKDFGGGFLDACALRIYDIRCKIVHSGATSKEDGEANILPMSYFDSALYIDIDLVEFLSVQVIIANATILKINQQ